MSVLKSNEGHELDGVSVYTKKPDSPFVQWMKRHGASVESGGVPPGAEVAAILIELVKRGALPLQAALTESQCITYQDGTLTVEFSADNSHAQLLRDGAEVFSDIGQRLFGRSISLEVVSPEEEASI